MPGFDDPFQPYHHRLSQFTKAIQPRTTRGILFGEWIGPAHSVHYGINRVTLRRYKVVAKILASAFEDGPERFVFLEELHALGVV